jgi:hypothetical protein
MSGSSPTGWRGRGLVLVFCTLTAACADKNSDPSKPADAGQKGLQERLSGGGGYKQDKDGNWVTKSDKRSSYDSQRDSAYFKGKMEKKKYSTGDYQEKKSWWGSKEYGAKDYEGNTGESRFLGTEARQGGMTARDDGKSARESGSFETNSHRHDGKSARESGSSPVERPLDAEVQSRRGVYKAPSVIDWKEQRTMSMEQSKGILGR